MGVYIKIFYESVILALQQLRSNKLRSFLSLLGITIGIFCIIAVQSAVDSLQNSIKSGLGELGNDVVIIDVMPWNEDPDMNYWKYMRRPAPSFDDYESLKKGLQLAKDASYSIFVSGKTIKYRSSNVQGAFIMGTTYEYPEVQNIEIGEGRYFTPLEYSTGDNKVIIGHTIADELFKQENPLGKYVKLFGHKFQVIAVLKEEGDNPFNFINYDEATWITYNTAKRFINTKGKDRFSVGKILYVKANEGVELDELKDEITGKLRSTRRLQPKEGDNFALNELSMINGVIDNVFGVVNIAGLFIGLFALIVGMISVANIMFVSVKERTNIIGIKKALGAKKYMIQLEFLIEAVILCLVGGLFGLLFVYGVMKAISSSIPFEMWLSYNNAVVGVVVSIVVGIVAGLIPAMQASRLDPVVAIRA